MSALLNLKKFIENNVPKEETLIAKGESFSLIMSIVYFAFCFSFWPLIFLFVIYRVKYYNFFALTNNSIIFYYPESRGQKIIKLKLDDIKRAYHKGSICFETFLIIETVSDAQYKLRLSKAESLTKKVNLVLERYK